MRLSGRISSARSSGIITTNNATLSGNINNDEILTSSISSNEEQLNGSLDNEINYSVITISGGEDPYLGPYNFIPSVYDIQTGYTAGKTMTQNITVQKIPQYEVSNPQGGLTLTIGEL